MSFGTLLAKQKELDSAMVLKYGLDWTLTDCIKNKCIALNSRVIQLVKEYEINPDNKSTLIDKAIDVLYFGMSLANDFGLDNKTLNDNAGLQASADCFGARCRDTFQARRDSGVEPYVWGILNSLLITTDCIMVYSNWQWYTQPIDIDIDQVQLHTTTLLVRVLEVLFALGVLQEGKLGEIYYARYADTKTGL
ncbi:MAG: hypothetical protein LBK70_02855 [Clostridiales bacterium]|jgi:hypothetical protein|nr:hypothetical protein [Clostridiales bacterium]